MSEKIFDIKVCIERCLDDMGLNYHNDEDDNTFFFSVNRDSTYGPLRMFVIYYNEAYTVRAVMGNHASASVRSRVGEFLHRANYGLKNGDFELDYNDGEVSYKVHASLPGMAPSEESIKRNIATPVAMFDRYGEGIMKVMFSKEKPKVILDKIEQNDIHQK